MGWRDFVTGVAIGQNFCKDRVALIIAFHQGEITFPPPAHPPTLPPFHFSLLLRRSRLPGQKKRKEKKIQQRERAR